jgi:molybdenum cofactor cytidylyltransferase
LDTNTKIGIVLLAAGSSSRMGHNKLSFIFEGKTMLQNTIDEAINSKTSDIVLVLGANHKENIFEFSGNNAYVVLNKNWKKGIGSSIKCGLQHLIQKQAKLNAVIISVCDQPYLTSEVFDRLISAYANSNKKIIASTYNELLGVPVLYDQSLFDDLLNIPDEHGAKKYVVEQAGKDILDTIPFPKGEIDIDTIEDIQNLTPP